MVLEVHEFSYLGQLSQIRQKLTCKRNEKRRNIRTFDVSTPQPQKTVLFYLLNVIKNFHCSFSRRGLISTPRFNHKLKVG